MCPEFPMTCVRDVRGVTGGAFCRLHVLIFVGHDHLAIFPLMSWDAFVCWKCLPHSRCMLGGRDGACPLAPSVCLMLDFFVASCDASLFPLCSSILEEQLVLRSTFFLFLFCSYFGSKEWSKFSPKKGWHLLNFQPPKVFIQSKKIFEVLHFKKGKEEATTQGVPDVNTPSNLVCFGINLPVFQLEARNLFVW